METKPIEKPLVVIVGPTASGKTSLAIQIARRWGGEIICADSRTIYKEMDIGTAKPTLEDRDLVPHWGLDLVRPDQSFSAAKFKQYANEKIEDIRSRGKFPILVGGTGLYVDGVIYNYQFGPKADSKLREELQNLSIDELTQYCTANNVTIPENDKNKRYLIRAIEQKSISASEERSNNDLISNCFVVGIATDKAVLRTRITERAEQLFEHGVVEEATLLGKKYGWNHQSMTGNIYPLIRSYLKDDLCMQEVVDKNTTLDWRLAKRQLTWLRRNPYIYWCTLTEASEYVDRVLAPEQPL